MAETLREGVEEVDRTRSHRVSQDKAWSLAFTLIPMRIIKQFKAGEWYDLIYLFKKITSGASLMVQWLRICLAMQETPVSSLVWEDPACLRVTEPMHHSYRACVLEPVSHNYRAHMPRVCVSQQKNALQRKACTSQPESTPPHSPQLEKACAQQ